MFLLDSRRPAERELAELIDGTIESSVIDYSNISHFDVTKSYDGAAVRWAERGRSDFGYFRRAVLGVEDWTIEAKSSEVVLWKVVRGELTWLELCARVAELEEVLALARSSTFLWLYGSIER